MIDLQNEKTLSLTQAAKLLPPGRQGRPVNLSTVFRWIADGVQAPDGSIVRLDAVRLGGRWLTSVEALQRFAEAQTPAPSTRPTFVKSPAARSKAAAKAGRALERAGA